MATVKKQTIRQQIEDTRNMTTELPNVFSQKVEPTTTTNETTKNKTNEGTGKPLVYTDTSGRATGFETPSGKTYLGATPEEVQSYVNTFNKVTGAQTVGEYNQANKPKLTMEEAQQLLNNPNTATKEQINAINQQTGGLDYGGAVMESLASGLKGAAVGAGAGLVAGPASLVTVPVAAAGGFVAGFLGSIYGNLKDNAQKDIAANYVSYQDSITNIKAIIKNAGKDPVDAIQLYQIELAKIDAAERNLKSLTETEWLGTSKKQLQKIENFNTFQRQQSYEMLLAAIANPNIEINFDVPVDTTETQQ